MSNVQLVCMLSFVEREGEVGRSKNPKIQKSKHPKISMNSSAKYASLVFLF